MFGYLRPDKPELKIREFEEYKSVYCGLCRQMGKDYGILSRFLLSFDCTVLAMLMASYRDEKCSVSSGRCCFNPLKKCRFCESSGESLRFAGAVCVIMAYYKLEDTIRDSGFFKKIAAYFLRAFFHRNYKRAAAAYPEIDSLTAEMMDMQLEAESSGSGVDRAAHPTAQLISRLCCLMVRNEEDKPVFEVFGYNVGRWIYLIDASDDLEKDVKHKSFNPFISKYESDGDISNTMSYCNEVLNLTASQIVLSYELISLTTYKSILDNIIYGGIPRMQKRCLFDKYREKDNKKKSTPESVGEEGEYERPV